MAEMSFHLLDQLFVQTLESISPFSPTITLDASMSPLPATEYLYPGAMVVIGWHSENAEVVVVDEVTGPSTFTVVSIIGPHNIGEIVFGATFPCQQTTDPVYTQAEIIGYIAQAQNEFLAKVPLIFEFFENNLVLLGQTFQTAPETSIEMERVAVQSNPPETMFNIVSVSRVANVVTCVLQSPSLPDQWTAGLNIQVYAVTDTSFNSVGNSLFELLSVSPDGLTLTWEQTIGDTTSTGGYVSRPILTRLYESAQEQIAMQNPWWFSQSGTPKAWFQDRSGIYGWGIAPVPGGSYYMEILASTRASEALTMLSFFNVPDIFVYAIKWRALSYCFGKDGVERSPTMERFAKGKFDFYCLFADRFLRNQIEKVGQMGAAAGGNF